MIKAYYKKVKEHPEESTTQTTPFEMYFEQTRELAAIYETVEQAENDCRNFEAQPIRVEGFGLCKGFGVEKLAPNRFVIFCEYPSDSAT